MLRSSPVWPTTPCTIHLTARPNAIATMSTTVEWPSEKKKPTPIGFLPPCSSLRVVLSMAEM